MDFDQQSIQDELLVAMTQLDLQLNDSQIRQLIELQSQLMKWTKAFNLTAITDARDILTLHLLDSLAIAPLWQSRKFSKTLDVGTGAGFPGLPLAIALPELEFHLLDSNSKKVRFIRQQIHHLGLKNVTVFHSRVQQHQVNKYDCIVSRAFASIKDMLLMTQPLLATGGYWMAMKGAYGEVEQAELPIEFKQLAIHPITVPGLNAQRCLVELTQ